MLNNGLPIIGSSWVGLVAGQEMVVMIESVEPPVTPRDEYGVMMWGPGIWFLVALSDFLTNWKPYQEPSIEGPSRLDRLLGEDLV